MSELLKDLRTLSDEDIIEKHDSLAERTEANVKYYLREIERRDQDRQTESMLKYTNWIKVMTVAIMIFTIINVAATIFLIMKQKP
ncbi:MAG: hypothetical protein ACYDGS_10065 [Thermoleophilia bacterium]